MGQLTLPLTGLVYIDASGLIYSMETASTPPNSASISLHPVSEGIGRRD